MQYSTSNSSNSSGSSNGSDSSGSKKKKIKKIVLYCTILYYEKKGLDGRTFSGPYMCNIKKKK